MFGIPISNQIKLPDNFPFGISVINNTTVSKILEIQMTLISDEGSSGDRCRCCRSPSFVAFKIPDLHSSPPVLLWNGLSILELHKAIFCLKCQEITVRVTSTSPPNLPRSTAPWKLPKILADDSKHKDCTYRGSDRKDPIAQLLHFPMEEKTKRKNATPC